MTPTLAATLNGALATTLVLFGLICAVWIAVDWLRAWRDDRRMRRTAEQTVNNIKVKV